MKEYKNAVRFILKSEWINNILDQSAKGWCMYILNVVPYFRDSNQYLKIGTFCTLTR